MHNYIGSKRGLTHFNPVLHPSFRDKYFKLAKWEPEWIAKAIRLTWDMWVTFYKPQSTDTTCQPPTSNHLRILTLSCLVTNMYLNLPQPRTSMLASLGSAAAARGGHLSTNPLDVWLAGGLILDGKKPVNLLRWWLQQKKSGNTHEGLLYMALDVLSCPGEF
ncbi:hypothetical protein PTTG_05186 [Puccinia triticina 1-1 BBBD Race 1]|uniref:Uncharacterized protein n=1 Tax=Puccinia triticina (isolate 1-1 / race 1 (BBBD)) TaxID=630390 RepID=A0A180GJA7_PUCT1|nr:hypothetical protein PTTG_05186 [Puccinia triticina 1-1 BBBD Race 1]